ncbi:MAG TPA: hypothetical protein VMR21_06605 [Vicinamibacteria bacterium]|nr:hypothetical protein [Vicinamibacteria bacterium]
MNARVLVPCLLLAAGCGGSGEPPAASPSAPPATMAMTLPSGPTFTAQVVTIDTAGPSITLREGDVPATASPRPGDLQAGDRTIRVEPAAASALATLKPGDRVQVTCMAPPAAEGTMAGGASPMAGMGSPGMASPGMGEPEATGATGGLAQCDSVVSITPAGATGP